MGRTLMGGTKRKEDIQMLTPQMQEMLSSTLSQAGPAYQQSLQQFLQPLSPEFSEQVFQKSFVDPAKQLFANQLQPQIMQQFGDANAMSSSALNQALAQAASDLSTSMGSQYGQFLQNQQTQQLQGLNLFQPLMTKETFTPFLEQKEGILGPLIGAAGALGAAAI